MEKKVPIDNSLFVNFTDDDFDKNWKLKSSSWLEFFKNKYCSEFKNKTWTILQDKNKFSL